MRIRGEFRYFWPNQTATIDLVASEATKAKALSETVAGQVAEGQKKLAALDAVTKAAQATLDNVRQARTGAAVGRPFFCARRITRRAKGAKR
jgi:hypothetical protein